VRSLVSNSIYAKKDRNGPPSANQVTLKTSPDAAMLFAPFRCTHPPPPVPPFLLTQNLSLMTDISAIGPKTHLQPSYTMKSKSLHVVTKEHANNDGLI